MNIATVIGIYNGENRNAHAIGFPDYDEAVNVYESAVALARICVWNGSIKEGNIFYLYRNGNVERKEII